MRTIPNQPQSLDRISKVSQKIYRQVSQFPFLPSFRRYNLTISEQQKFIWFRVAKVGTRTILNHFKENGVRLDVEHPSYIHYSPNLYKDYFKFALVRNPWDRLVSCWKNKVVEMNYFNFNPSDLEAFQDFTTFVNYIDTLNIATEDRHLRLQCTLIDLSNIDYLGRIENFDRDFHYICDRLNIQDRQITSQNVSFDRKNYREYYDDHLRDKVGQIYGKDIQIFGYEF
jgi:hypothetical protein